MLTNSHSKPDTNGKKSVLVVDDMEANRAVLCRRLERYDYSVTSVDSGAAALQSLKYSIPDIILLDFMMPQMNGIEVLHELKSDPATSDIPVIMVTARAEGAATIEALEAGADEYVTKPIDFDVLRVRIETHLSKGVNANDLRRANAALDERVTRRSLALADLEEELQGEIGRRKELEALLASVQSGDATPAHGSPELGPLLETICDRFDFVFQIITAGRAPNLAQIADLKSMLEKAKNLAHGRTD